MINNYHGGIKGMIQVLKHKIMDLQNETLPFSFSKKPFKKRKNDYYFLMLRKINTLDRKLQNIEDLFSFYFDRNCNNSFHCNNGQYYNLPKFYDSIHSLIDLANKIKEEMVCKKCNLSHNNNTHVYDKIHLLESELHKFSTLLEQIKTSELYEIEKPDRNNLKLNISKCNAQQKCLEERTEPHPQKNFSKSGISKNVPNGDGIGFHGHRFDNCQNYQNLKNDSDSYHVKVTRHKHGQQSSVRPVCNLGRNSRHSKPLSKNGFPSQYHVYTNSKNHDRQMPYRSSTPCYCCESTNVRNGSVDDVPYHERTLGPSRSLSQCSCDSCMGFNPQERYNRSFVQRKSQDVYNIKSSRHNEPKLGKIMSKKRQNKAKQHISGKKNANGPNNGEENMNYKHQLHYLAKDNSENESIYKPIRHQYSDGETVYSSPEEFRGQDSKPSRKLILLKQNNKSNKFDKETSKSLSKRMSNNSYYRVSVDHDKFSEQNTKAEENIDYDSHKLYQNLNKKIHRNSELKYNKKQIGLVLSEEDIIFVNENQKQGANSNNNIYFLYSESDEENKNFELKENRKKQFQNKKVLTVKNQNLKYEPLQVKCQKVCQIEAKDRPLLYNVDPKSFYHNQTFQKCYFQDKYGKLTKVSQNCKLNLELNSNELSEGIDNNNPDSFSCTLPVPNNMKDTDRHSSGSSSCKVYVCNKKHCAQKRKPKELVFVMKSSDSLLPKQKKDAKINEVVYVPNIHKNIVLRNQEPNETVGDDNFSFRKNHKETVVKKGVVNKPNNNSSWQNTNTESVKPISERYTGSGMHENVYNNRNIEMFQAGIEQGNLFYKHNEINSKNNYLKNNDKESFTNKENVYYADDSHTYKEEHSENLSRNIPPQPKIKNYDRLDIAEQPKTASKVSKKTLDTLNSPKTKTDKINQQSSARIDDNNLDIFKSQQKETPKRLNTNNGKSNNMYLPIIINTQEDKNYINRELDQASSKVLQKVDYIVGDKENVSYNSQEKPNVVSTEKNKPELFNKKISENKILENPKFRESEQGNLVVIKHQPNMEVENKDNKIGLEEKHENLTFTNPLPLKKLCLKKSLKNMSSYQSIGYKGYLYSNTIPCKSHTAKKTVKYTALPKKFNRSKTNNIRQSTSVLPVKIKNQNKLCPKKSCYNGGYAPQLKRILKDTQETTNFSSEVINLVRKSLELNKYPYQTCKKLNTSDSNTDSILVDGYEKMFISALTSDSSSFSMINWQKVATKLKEENCDSTTQTN